jgi:hypothetical protein
MVIGLFYPPFGMVGSEALRASGEGRRSVRDAATALPDGSYFAVDHPKGRVKSRGKVMLRGSFVPKNRNH